MSVFLSVLDIRLVVCRTSSRVLVEVAEIAGLMIEPRKDSRVYFAPSTRTAEMLTGVFKFPFIYSVVQQFTNKMIKDTTYNFRKVKNGRLVFTLKLPGYPVFLPLAQPA